MKFAAVLLLAGVLQVSARTNGQTVTFSGSSIHLQKVFSAIEQQTGYLFFYRGEDLVDSKPVTINFKDVPLKIALEKTLVGQSLQFSIQGNTVFVTRIISSDLSPRLSFQLEAPPVTGVVRGPDGKPLAGVKRSCGKESNRGVVTDLTGKFSIEAEKGKTLVISNIGYTAKEIKVSGEHAMIIGLEISPSQLDEVQYIAYGKNSPRFQTGNVASIKAADIEKQPINNPLLALQGRVPGLFITQTSGSPGAGIRVLIQRAKQHVEWNQPIICDRWLYLILPNSREVVLATRLAVLAGS